jgi:uncharacterized C2H2 Zn-finger protein
MLERNLPAMPLIVRAIAADLHYTVKKERRGIIFKSRVGRPHNSGFKQVDVHAIRRQFEMVESPEELLALLNELQLPLVSYSNTEFSWMAFMRVQELLQVERERTRHFGPREKSWYLNGASDPLLNSPDFEEFNVDLHIEKTHKGKPVLRAHMYCDGILHAVRLANYIDELVGVDFGKCGWCGKLFERTTTHKREFCNTEHAHREGQRRRRAEAKEMKHRARQQESTVKLSKGKV